MKKIWKTMGVVAFWAVWPALFVYLRIGKRTRVLIVCGDEFLALKTWLGSGAYGLPGGGLHKGEEPVKGALREVREETGLELREANLKFLFTKAGRPIKYTAFVVTLSEKPAIRPQKGEISDYDWLSVNDTTQHFNDDVQEVLTYWKNQG